MRYGERSGEGMMWILSLIVTSAQAATVNVPSTSAPTITEALEQLDPTGPHTILLLADLTEAIELPTTWSTWNNPPDVTIMSVTPSVRRTLTLQSSLFLGGSNVSFTFADLDVDLSQVSQTDGFVITSGNVTLENVEIYDYEGTYSAVFVNGGSLYATDSSWRDNDSSTAGAAITIFGGSASVNGGVFEQNYASQKGGAINIDGALNEPLYFNDCTFTNNGSGANGGSLFAANVDDLTISNTTFEGSESSSSGGAVSIDLYQGQEATLTDLNIYDNAASFGGGLHLGGSGGIAYILDVDICGNTAETGGGLALGDAMSGAGPTTYVRRAILRENSATGTALNGSGGGFAVVGSPGSATSLYMDHTTFLGNSANSATDGLFSSYGYFDMFGSTVSASIGTSGTPVSFYRPQFGSQNEPTPQYMLWGTGSVSPGDGLFSDWGPSPNQPYTVSTDPLFHNWSADGDCTNDSLDPAPFSPGIDIIPVDVANQRLLSIGWSPATFPYGWSGTDPLNADAANGVLSYGHAGGIGAAGWVFDSDNDGTPDILDCADNDPTIPTSEPTPDCDEPFDRDCDGLFVGPDDDSDGDGLTAAEEFALGTTNCYPDSDLDGLDDGEEVTLGPACLDPLNPDSDGDGLSDGDEKTEAENAGATPGYCTPDSDGDGLFDGFEAVFPGASPFNFDDDGDGIPTACEFAWSGYTRLITKDDDCTTATDGTVPNEDVIINGEPICPVNFGVSSCDRDGDGLSDAFDADDDGDGILTKDESIPAFICSNAPRDVDADGLPDHLDTDNEDGPFSDPDADGIPRCWELSTTCGETANMSNDADGDGILDSEELGVVPPVITNAAAWIALKPLQTGLPPIDLCDPDDDDDGLPTAVERQLQADLGRGDLDADGLPAWRDNDIDNDRVLDCLEVGWMPDDPDAVVVCPENLASLVDLTDLPDVDGDGIPDIADDSSTVGPAADAASAPLTLPENGLGCAHTPILPSGAGLLVLALLRRRRTSRRSSP